MTPLARPSRRTLLVTGSLTAFAGTGMSAARASSGFTNPVIPTNQPDPGILRTPEG